MPWIYFKTGNFCMDYLLTLIILYETDHTENFIDTKLLTFLYYLINYVRYLNCIPKPIQKNKMFLWNINAPDYGQFQRWPRSQRVKDKYLVTRNEHVQYESSFLKIGQMSRSKGEVLIYRSYHKEGSCEISRL